MFDQVHAPGPHPDTSQQALDDPRIPLRAGDVVMCKFPSAEARRTLEKIRPCLVLDATDDEIILAYGTTRDSHVRRSRELHVLRVEELAAAGLWRPTRFLGWRTVRLPCDSDRLRPAPDGGVICGHLSSRYRRGLAHMRALACPDPALPETSRGRRRNRPVFLGGAIR
jgi:hypothetical protein